MSQVVRPIQEADLVEIAKWFESVSWPLPAVAGALPQDGFVAVSGELMTACCFTYPTGTSVAHISWTATNPRAADQVASDGMAAVIKRVQELARAARPEVNCLKCDTKNEAFAQKLKGLGFRVTQVYQCTWVG